VIIKKNGESSIPQHMYAPMLYNMRTYNTNFSIIRCSKLLCSVQYMLVMDSAFYAAC
jgi:hypothetical protein